MRKINFQLGVLRTPNQKYGGCSNHRAGRQAWNALPPGNFGVIVLMDSRTYLEDLTALNNLSIQIPADSQLMIVAKPGIASAEYRAANITPTNLRPLLDGVIEVQGIAPAGSTNPGQLIINGVWIVGGIHVLPGKSRIIASGLFHDCPAKRNHHQRKRPERDE